MKNRLLIPTLAVFIFFTALSLYAPAVSAAKKGKSKSCEQKTALVNYRSDLLVVMQRSETTKYKAVRAKWSERITYASRWVPNEAKKAQEDLYKYDALHTVLDKELSKQIKANRYLQKKPLTCSSRDEAKLTKKVEEIHGYKGKKAVSGNALIAEYQKQQTAFFNKKFKKTADKMVDKLHQAKSEHHAPHYKPLEIKQV